MSSAHKLLFIHTANDGWLSTTAKFLGMSSSFPSFQNTKASHSRLRDDCCPHCQLDILFLQGYFKDPEFQGYVMLAHDTEQRRLPVHLFQLARSIQQWSKQKLPNCGTPESFLVGFRDYLNNTPIDPRGKSLLLSSRLHSQASLAKLPHSQS